MPKNQDIPLQLYQVLEQEYESLHGPMPDEVPAWLPNPRTESKPLRVVSKRDWEFHEGHLKSPALFAELLLSEDARQAAAHHDGPNDARVAGLRKFLRAQIGEEVLRAVVNSARDADTKKTDAKDADAKDAGAKSTGAKSTGAKSTNAKGDDAKDAAAKGTGAKDGDAKGESPEVKALRDGLNEALARGDLYGEEANGELVAGRERFAYEWLSDGTRGLLALRESGVAFGVEAVKQFNRLLLEDAFTDLFHKVSDVRLAAVYSLLHERRQAALSLSGGGIRSGTFALGLMQGLARHRLLEKFSYLSTVSGGGYTGSWLTAWIHRHPEGMAGVERELAEGDGEKIDPDADALRYLRRYSNFITPKVGLLTADTWTFVGIYLRNTFLNWLVFVPLILAVLLIPRLLIGLTLMQDEPKDLTPFVAWGEPAGALGLRPGIYGRDVFLALGILLGSWALAYVIFNRPALRRTLEERRPWFRGKTGQGGFLLMCLLPLLASAFCLTTYYAWAKEIPGWYDISPLNFVLFGMGFTLIGWAIAYVVLKRKRWRRADAAELFSLLAVGFIGGVVLYSLSQISFPAPVIGYGPPPGGDKPFDWLTTDWTKWLTEIYVCSAVPLFLLAFLLSTTVFVGITSTPRVTFVEDEDREWWSRFGAWVLISIIVWVGGNTLVIFGPIALLALPTLLGSVGGASGLVTLLAGRSSKTPAAEGTRAEQSRLAGLMGSLLPLLAFVFIAFLVAALSLATSALVQGLAIGVAPWLHAKLSSLGLGALFNPDWLTNAATYEQYKQLIYSGIPAHPRARAAQLAHMNVLHHTWTWFVLALGLLLAVFGVALARVINLNIFSLHGGYRNRLIRAFLGASRPDHERKPNPFTGFDPADDLHMHELRPALLDEGDFLKPGLVAASLKAAMDDGKPRAPEPDADAAAAGGDEPPPSAEAVSQYLVRVEKANERRGERLKNAQQVLRDFSPDTPVSSRLIADLRADLNTVLTVDHLYRQDFAQALLESERAREVVNAVKRSQGLRESDDIKGVRPERLSDAYHILLNRLVLEAAYPGAFRPCAYPPPRAPLHVVNTTLNLVGGSNLAWQQRRAEPFSVSPLHSGCFRIGYRNSRDYGGRATNGISLGTAATASGAAASSNMGYYTTSPLISLLLTLFNVRLGCWLGNPGPHGQDTYHLSAPTLSFKPVLSEAFGLTDDTNEYVYLTDGGHFENLALYEMVLRRCHFIVVSDAAQDEQFRFGDLGNAVRKIRIDLGVPIDFWDMPIYPEAPKPEEGRGVYWALARVRYTCVDKGASARDGVLLYVKPTVYGDEPRDVLEYKKSFPAFPHQSTGDQFFDEPQFESYRMLGSYIMERICGDDRKSLSLAEMMCKAFEGLKEAKPQKLEEPFRLNAKFVEWMEDWCAGVKAESAAQEAEAAPPSELPSAPVDGNGARAPAAQEAEGIGEVIE